MSTEPSRKKKRLLAPQEEVRNLDADRPGETTVSEAAERSRVDDDRQAPDGGPRRRPGSVGEVPARPPSERPGLRAPRRLREAETERLRTALAEMAVRLTLAEGKRALGLSGRVPRRIDAATKHALLGLVDEAVDGGWTNRAACRYLEVSPIGLNAGVDGSHPGRRWTIWRRAGTRSTGSPRPRKRDRGGVRRVGRQLTGPTARSPTKRIVVGTVLG